MICHPEGIPFTIPNDRPMLYTVETLLVAAECKGLVALGEEVRAVEAADPDGHKFPRFKTSDDATAVLLRISGPRTGA